MVTHNETVKLYECGFPLQDEVLMSQRYYTFYINNMKIRTAHENISQIKSLIKSNEKLS